MRLLTDHALLFSSFLVFSAVVEVSRANPIAEKEREREREKESNDVNNHQLITDCRNPDYRSYIKCLTKQRRSRDDHQAHCVESCVSKCVQDDEDDCNRKCGGHCLKKKRKHQVITEYEVVCDDCDDKPNAPSQKPNVTTKIDIHNINHNYNNFTGSVSSIPCNPQENVTCPPVNGGGFGSFDFELTLVPQITFGLGIKPRCVYGFPWLCPPVSNKKDCTKCGYPGYGCDSSCYPGNQSSMPCVSPFCVGGGM